MMRARHGQVALTTLALALASLGGATSSSGSPSPALAPALVLAPADEPQTVEFQGVALAVPAGWAIIDLAAEPRACVRFDVNAVYLGTPSDDPDCPAVVVGRTNAVLLQPLPAELPYGTVVIEPGSDQPPDPAQVLAGEVIGLVAGSQVLVTVAFGDDIAQATRILSSLSLTSVGGLAAAPEEPTLAALALPAQLDRSFTWHHGYGFDTCVAPSLGSMQAWLSSPYRSIGIYIGGIARGCPNQPNLTPSWIRSIATMGWKAQPIYVGLQAPCSSYTNKITYGQEWTQGRDAALDAIGRAQALGIGPGSDIYYDMESYPRGTQCSGSVRAYLSSWTATLQYNGYSSGVYSSAATGIADLADGAAQPGFVPPDKIWIARWNGVPNVYGHTAYVADNQWAPYRRMHQYTGGHVETWGGVSINIDSDFLDTDPNRGNPFGQFEAATAAPSKITARGWAIDPDTSGPIIVQGYVDGVFNAMTWANQPRPDVGSYFPASGPDHGYNLPMSIAPGRHSVCIYAVNTGAGFSTSLGCRAVDVPTSNPFGNFESASADFGAIATKGWMIDPDTSGPIIVQMYVDGVFGAMGWANSPRADVGRAFPAYGPDHGFTLTVPASPGRHTICGYAVNTGPGTSTSLGCRAVTVPSRDPFGNFESAVGSAGTIDTKGWMIDPDTSGPIIVQMYVDGVFGAMGWANSPRADVGRAFPAYGPDHGFTLTVPASPGRHTICGYAVNTGPGTSTSLGCHAVTVA